MWAGHVTIPRRSLTTLATVSPMSPEKQGRKCVMSALRIYGIARTRAFRALWMAEELRLAYEHLPIEIGDAGARTPEFLAINPNGRLPVIVDGGFVLFESLAITLYLAKKHSPGKLYPADCGTRPRPGNGAFGPSPRSTAASISGRCMRSACRRPNAMRQNATRRLKSLPRRSRFWTLPSRAQPYLLGGDFTVADLNVAAVISRAVDMDLSAVPNLKAWLTRCLERPAARAALALKTKADAETPADVTRHIARINRL